MIRKGPYGFYLHEKTRETIILCANNLNVSMSEMLEIIIDFYIKEGGVDKMMKERISKIEKARKKLTGEK